MSAAASQIPGVGSVRFPFTRSRALLAFVGFNFFGLAGETALAHLVDHNLHPYELIPLWHGLAAGAAMLWLALRARPGRLEIALLLLTLLSAVMVGLLGSAFHWQRALLGRTVMPGGSLQWLVFAPPVAGPMAFCGVALVGLLAALQESPRDSGRLSLWAWIHLTAPVSKTRQLVALVGLGYAGATVSVVLDHARSSFENPAVWIAVASTAFATAVTLGRALVREPDRADDLTYFWTQVLMLLVGVLGAGMHLSADLAGTGGISVERLLTHAPPIAPLLLTNLGLFGLLSVLRPAEPESGETEA